MCGRLPKVIAARDTARLRLECSRVLVRVRCESWGGERLASEHVPYVAVEVYVHRASA